MAWFNWGKRKDDCGDGDTGDDKPAPPPKPTTTDEANRAVLDIIKAPRNQKLMKNLRRLIADQTYIFPPLPNETTCEKEYRQDALISTSINNIHEEFGLGALVTRAVESIFIEIDKELCAMNISDDYGRWAQLARRAVGHAKAEGIIKQ